MTMPTLMLQLDRTTAVTPSPRVLAVAGMFGLGIDRAHTLTIVPRVELTLPPGGVVFVTGASGSGKSSLLQLIADQIPHAIRFDALPPLPDAPLVDALDDAPLTDTMRRLTAAGLSDAFVMLRRPGELSDGQRYRLRLAQVMAIVETQAPHWHGGAAACVVLADEFAATLDRITAAVLARNVRRWVSRRGDVCFVVATTHDDLLEPLDPDVLVEKHLDGGIEVVAKEAAGSRQ